MINKKGFSTQDFVISGLLFTAVVLLFSLGIADIQTHYPDNPNIVSDSFQDNYAKLSDQTDKIALMRNTSLSGEGLTFRGAFDVAFGSFFTVMQLVFSTLDLFSDIYVNFTTDFPFIDALILNNALIILFSILTVILVFRLINAVGRNPV